jgi:ABC-type sugar transport system permease subunit
MKALTSAEQGGPAWLFLSPALTLIGLFFFVPVAASLLLSFTDFDIYAIADLSNIRVVGLRNYTRLLESPIFWSTPRWCASRPCFGPCTSRPSSPPWSQWPSCGATSITGSTG